MRSGQYLTHAHIYITGTVKKNACSLTDGKREIQSEPAEKLELILAIVPGAEKSQIDLTQSINVRQP